MRRGGEPTPWGIWTVGWMIAIVLTGGVVYVITDTESPVRVFKDPVVVETSIRDVTVLPRGLSKVQGTVTALHGIDVTAPALRTPLEFPAGAGATIEGALIGGKRATIVWDGGRPLVLQGGGGLDLGPTRLEVDSLGAATWPLDDGVRVMLKGHYVIRTPVAVGSGGLAQARDQVEFDADDVTTIETRGVTVRTGPGPLHLEGPGSITLDGDFTVETKEGTRQEGHLELTDGNFIVDLEPTPEGLRVIATLQQRTG